MRGAVTPATRKAQGVVPALLKDSPWQPAGETTPDKTEFSEPGGEKGHNTYRVRAVGEHGPSPWSNPAWVDIEK
jgi:hypothetical protein